MAEYIDRDKALAETWRNPSYTDAMNALTEIRDRLRALPAAEPEQRWIPCDRMLPEKHERAITLYDNGKISGGEYIGDRTWNVDYGDSDKKVKIVAWLPMPEVYREEGEQDD